MILPNFTEESKLWNKGYKYVIGVDEVGRGAFAGPVCVAAVIFKCETEEITKLGINDSKLLKPLKRSHLSKIIKKTCLHYSIATVGVSKINKDGIGKATQTAFRMAIKNVIKQAKTDQEFFLLIDGFAVKNINGIGLKNQKPIIKGDRSSISIAAASIIAKVYRDSIMENLSKKYKEYGFEKHKGYGTLEHRAAIKKHGLSKIHRTSFKLSKFL